MLPHPGQGAAAPARTPAPAPGVSVRDRSLVRRHARRGPDRLDAATALLVLAWSTVVLPRLVQTLTAAKYRSTLEDAAPVSAIALRLDQGLTAALILASVLIVAQRLDALPTRRRAALVVLLAPWAYLVLRDVYAGTLPLHQAQLVYPAVITALWALQPRLQSLSVLGYLTAATAMVSILLAVAVPDKGLYRAATGDLISPAKEILPWGVLVGPFTDGNNLGQFLVLGFPALLFVARRWLRLLLASCTGFALLWTASRSSLAALVVALLAGLCLVRAPAKLRRAVAAGLLLGLTGVGVVVPIMASSDGAFTNRGILWSDSFQAWSRQPTFGLGSTWYAEIAPSVNGLGGYAFHAHNQFVQTLVVGGLLNVVLVGVLYGAVTRDAARWAASGSLYPAVSFATFLVSGTLEVPLGFVDRDFLLAVTYLPVAFTVFAVAHVDPRSRPSEAPAASRQRRDRRLGWRPRAAAPPPDRPRSRT